MSMKQKVLNMITEANTTTGESDTNLTDAVASLIDGYGGVTPTGTKEITDTSLTDVTEYANAQVVDANLVAGNIKKDVNILGIEGTFEGGGSHPTKGFVPTAWNADGYFTDGVWYGDTIPERAFYYQKITTISFPPTLEEIGKEAFMYCSNLGTTFTFPSSLKKINISAFSTCKGLTAVFFLGTFGLGGTLSSYTFQYCTNLLDIYVPWSQGAVSGAPWGASNATVHYNWTPTE